MRDGCYTYTLHSTRKASNIAWNFRKIHKTRSFTFHYIFICFHLFRHFDTFWCTHICAQKRIMIFLCWCVSSLFSFHSLRILRDVTASWEFCCQCDWYIPYMRSLNGASSFKCMCERRNTHDFWCEPARDRLCWLTNKTNIHFNSFTTKSLNDNNGMSRFVVKSCTNETKRIWAYRFAFFHLLSLLVGWQNYEIESNKIGGKSNLKSILV